MPAPRHARPSSRRPFAAACAVALGAAAVAVPLAAQAQPEAPVKPRTLAEPLQDDPHVLQVSVARLPAVRRTALPAWVTVQSGDTLSALAGRYCGNPDGYLALAYNNGVADPDLIYAGQVFKIACQAAAEAIASRYSPLKSSPPSPPVHYVSRQSDADDAPAPVYRHSSGAVVTSVSGTYAGSNSMQQCIIARESGGNSQVVNATGHYGLYQFSASTWAAHGGNPADFGHASVAEQNQVYAQTVHDDGYSDWSPYDGCTP